MPTYEYKCTKCDHQFELWQEVGAAAPACPECGAEMQKIFFPVRTIFKGSGFYITDNRSPAAETSAGSKAKEPASTSAKSDSGDS